MTLLLAAVGATFVALVELTVGPYLRVGGAQPHLVLVVGIIVTVAMGLETGLVWAFIGGSALDVLAQRPLGSTAFALLLCTGATDILARIFVRVRPLVPVIATALLSVALLDDLVHRVERPRGPHPGRDPVSLVTPSAVYDALLAALVGPLVDLDSRPPGRA